MHSLSHFSPGVLKTQTWRWLADFSTKHSSLHITFVQSSASHPPYFNAHSRRCAAYSSVRSGLLAANHFLLLWSFKNRLTVDLDTWGVLELVISPKVWRQLLFASLMMCCPLLLVNLFGLSLLRRGSAALSCLCRYTTDDTVDFDSSITALIFLKLNFSWCKPMIRPLSILLMCLEAVGSLIVVVFGFFWKWWLMGKDVAT